MNAIIKKLFHEFWLAKGRFLLCVLATAVAGWGVSSVVYSYLMAERDFKVNYLAARSADFSMTIEHFNERISETLKQDSQVDDFERREMLSGRVKNSKEVWMTLILFAAEDVHQQRLDKFRIVDLQSGHRDYILIEQNANDFLDYVSDTAVMQFQNKPVNFSLRKAGIVHDARMAPAQMEQVVYGYAPISSIESLLTPGQVRLIFKAKNTPYTKVALDSLAQRLKKVVSSLGGEVANIQVPTPGQHIHQPIIDGISFLQKSFGSILIVLGITLLSLILLTWLFPQLVQVGIIKAIGASTTQILLGFVTVLGVVIALGLSIGLPLGHYSAGLFNKFVAFIQNFETVKETFPVQTHLLVALTAAVLPFLFGLLPIIQVSKTTVRQTLGVTFRYSHAGIIRFVQKLFLSVTWRYASGNLFRSGLRTTLLMSLMAVGTALFFTGANLQYSFREDFTRYYNGSHYQVTINLTDTLSRKLGFLRELPFVESLACLRTLRLSYQVPDNGRIQSATLKIFPRDYRYNESLVAMGKVDRSCTDCLFVHPSTYESGFKTVDIGDTITLVRKNGETSRLRFAGVLKDVAGVHGGGALYQFSTEENPYYGQVTIALKPGTQIPDALHGLESALAANDIRYSGLSDVDTALLGAINHFKPTYYIVQGMGLFTVIVSLLGMLIVVNLTIQERTTEIGILKALGSSSGRISGFIMLEFMVITTVSVGAGGALAFGFTGFLCDLYGVMVRGQAIPPLIHYPVTLISIVVILLAQTLLIFNFSRSRIRRSANALLNFVA